MAIKGERIKVGTTTELEINEAILNKADPSQEHPQYSRMSSEWTRIRDCLKGEDAIKEKTTTYLPRPAGMSGEYEAAYDDYIERAHFPLTTSYALSGALGVVITKMPEFNLPPALQYLEKDATKDGRTLNQLFLDIVTEIMQTGRCPIAIDIDSKTNKFVFVRYNAEQLINWKEEVYESQKDLKLAVLKEQSNEGTDVYAHDYEDVYRVLYLTPEGAFATMTFNEDGGTVGEKKIPNHTGNALGQIPLVVAGSISNSYDPQPIPLLSVANCSVQIYRKEADLANSEFLSCNPTLVLSGAADEDDLPNVVGSSVMIALPDPQARVYYTKTDTQALTHVKDHISDLYEEAIRHGVAILDTRKGVEAAEALRIRQATQSATIYSTYLSAITAIRWGLSIISTWSGTSEEGISVDAPQTLTYGIPDSAILRELVSGYGGGVVPLPVVHRYLINNGLLDQRVSVDEYTGMLEKYEKYIKVAPIMGKGAVEKGATGTTTTNAPVKPADE